MDKMKMRLMAMNSKAKASPFGKESMEKLNAKKNHGGMEQLLAEMAGEGESEEEGMPEEIGELSPEEIKLVLAFRKKKEMV